VQKLEGQFSVPGAVFAPDPEIITAKRGEALKRKRIRPTV
jgi:hypothetical protein